MRQGLAPANAWITFSDAVENQRATKYHAGDHQGVSEAISAGWAQAGVCVRLPAEERGLQFFKVREENYDLCFLAEEEGDPRLQALLTAVRSVSYEKDLQQLPGYHTENTGELH